MKSLNTIQTLAKVGKIFSKIVCICCIVGFVGCLAGGVSLLVGAETIKIGGVTVESFLQTETGIGEGTIVATIAVGMILCAGEFVISRMSHHYFENELHAGTPFTHEGATELLHLGISAICISLLAVILSEVAEGVISGLIEGTEPLSLDGFGSISYGLVLIVVSRLCKYGAELRDTLA